MESCLSEDERRAIYRSLIEEAPLIPVAPSATKGAGASGVSSSVSASIPWLNEELLREGREFYGRHALSINLSHIGTLLFGLAIKPVSTLLFRNAKFGSAESARVRWVETVAHMSSWYTAPLEVAAADVRVVARLHALILKKWGAAGAGANSWEIPALDDDRHPELVAFLASIKADLEHVDTAEAPLHLFTYAPPVLMSQFDLAITQFGFFAFVVMAPATLGIRDRDTQGMAGFIHLWAVLGRLLGIEDRFNLALRPDAQLYKLIYDQIAIGSLQTSDLAAMEAQFTFGRGLSRLLPTTPKAALYFALDSKETLPGFKGTQMWACMNWVDKVALFGLRVLIFILFHFEWFRNKANQAFATRMRKPKANLSESRRAKRR